jgi:hypothetical protein
MGQALARLMLRSGGVTDSLRLLAPNCPQCGRPYKAVEGWCRSCDYVDESHRVDLSGVEIRPALRPEPADNIESTAFQTALAANERSQDGGIGLIRGGGSWDDEFMAKLRTIDIEEILPATPRSSRSRRCGPGWVIAARSRT